MKTVSLAFYRADKGRFYDKLVAFTTRGDFSHVELRLQHKPSFSASPREKRSRFKTIDFLSDRWLQFHINIDENEDKLIYDFCNKELNKPFDYSGELGFSRKPNNCQHRKWFSAELAVAALCETKVWPKVGNYSRLTPSSLAKLVLSNPVKYQRL